MVVATYNSCLQAALSIPGYTESDATYSLGEKISALNIKCLHVRMWERLIEVSLLHVQDYKDFTDRLIFNLLTLSLKIIIKLTVLPYFGHL